MSGGGRPFGIGHDHFVARLEQRLKRTVESMDAAGRHEYVLGIVDRNPVLVPQLRRDQLAQAGQTVGLDVMSLVVGDRARHRRLDRVGRIEADVALVEAKRILDREHQVADVDDTGKRNAVEVGGHASA